MLEDFLFFSPYSFSCIAKQSRLRHSFNSCLVLISSIRTLSALSRLRYHIIVTNIPYSPPCPLQAFIYTIHLVQNLYIHNSELNLFSIVFQLLWLADIAGFNYDIMQYVQTDLESSEPYHNYQMECDRVPNIYRDYYLIV